MRKTIIDIGTNTILLLIADYDNTFEKIRTITDIQRIPRLGKKVDSERKIQKEAFDKATEIILEYKNISFEYESHDITAVATSFLRDSYNKNEFINHIEKHTGIKISILSGEDEARWTFIGGIYDTFNHGKITTIDIGGGSTEITFDEVNSTEIQSLTKLSPCGLSLNIGSVRIKEKFLINHPPEFDKIIQAENFINEELGKIPFNLSNSTLIGLAGTITSLGAYKLKLGKFIPEEVDKLIITVDETETFLKELATTPIEEIYGLGDYMKGRADVITSGVLILKCFMEKFGFKEIIVSTKGLRYGIFIREIADKLREI